MAVSIEPLLDQKEACRLLGVSRHTLLELRRRARHPLPYLRVGRLLRFRRGDLEEWARRCAETELEEPSDRAGGDAARGKEGWTRAKGQEGAVEPGEPRGVRCVERAPPRSDDRKE